MLQTIEFSDYGPKNTAMKFNNKIKFSQINLFAGDNGSGKTLLFKAAWFMQFTMQLYKINQLVTTIPYSDERFRKDLEVIFDLTWTAADQISGGIEVRDNDLDPSYIYRVRIEDGKILSFDIDVLDQERFKVGEIQQISYNTKDARTFSQYDRYIKLCKKFNFDINQMDPQNDDLKEMGEFYRIYDMLWFEKVRHEIKAFNAGEPAQMIRLEHWDKVFGEHAEKDKFPSGSQFVFKKNTVFVDNELGDLKRVSDYDSGTQSLIMMTLFGG